jgi:hypothetical protein
MCDESGSAVAKFHMPAKTFLHAIHPYRNILRIVHIYISTYKTPLKYLSCK